MKKMLCLVFAALMLLAICSPVVTAFADEVTYAESNGASEGTIETEHREYSTFTLEIPARVTTDNDAFVRVVYANIAPGYQVEIYATNLLDDGSFLMYHDSDNNISAPFVIMNSKTNEYATNEQPLIASVTDEEIAQSGEYTYATFRLWPAPDAGNIRAGSYSGELCYRIECNPTN